MTSWPLFFDDATPFNRVKIAGQLVLATAVKMNGIAIEAEWKKQKSKDASGAVFAFQGMNPVGGESGFSITFRITNSAEEAQLASLWDALKPVPVLGSAATSTTASTGTPTTSKVGSPPAPSGGSAQQILADLQKSLAAVNNPTPAATTSTADATTTTTAASQSSPGPRPPTVPIELGWLARLGVFAGAMKKWSFDDLDSESHSDRYDVTIGFVANDPPKPAGTGAMAAAKPATASTGGTATPSTSAAPLFLNASAGAAGT
jgi:hypothetical protein